MELLPASKHLANGVLPSAMRGIYEKSRGLIDREYTIDPEHWDCGLAKRERPDYAAMWAMRNANAESLRHEVIAALCGEFAKSRSIAYTCVMSDYPDVVTDTVMKLYGLEGFEYPYQKLEGEEQRRLKKFMVTEVVESALQQIYVHKRMATSKTVAEFVSTEIRYPLSRPSKTWVGQFGACGEKEAVRLVDPLFEWLDSPKPQGLHLCTSSKEKFRIYKASHMAADWMFENKVMTRGYRPTVKQIRDNWIEYQEFVIRLNNEVAMCPEYRPLEPIAFWVFMEMLFLEPDDHELSVIRESALCRMYFFLKENG